MVYSWSGKRPNVMQPVLTSVHYLRPFWTRRLYSAFSRRMSEINSAWAFQNISSRLFTVTLYGFLFSPMCIICLISKFSSVVPLCYFAKSTDHETHCTVPSIVVLISPSSAHISSALCSNFPSLRRSIHISYKFRPTDKINFRKFCMFCALK
jgi:hypothetical protein